MDYVAQLQHNMDDPEQLKKAVDEKSRIEHEVWVAAGRPYMEAKDGKELKEGMKVGFPCWLEVKSQTTLEPVQKAESMEQADAPLSSSLPKSAATPETSGKALVDTAFGAREVIV